MKVTYTQFSLVRSADSMEAVRTRYLEAALEWMRNNKLKLNPEKNGDATDCGGGDPGNELCPILDEFAHSKRSGFVACGCSWTRASCWINRWQAMGAFQQLQLVTQFEALPGLKRSCHSDECPVNI